MKHLILHHLNNAEPRQENWGFPSHLNNLFDAFLEPISDEEDRNLTPLMDLEEKKDKYLLKVELPGIDEKDMALSYEDGLLTISGEKKSETEEKEKNYYLKECSYGSFKRSIRLPENIVENKIEAHFKKGVLKIEIPKKEETEPKSRQIEIKS
ncbi:MAG: Hsp20/alpha crystallin family protein [Alphaproteobacteria bacterium]|nr:Hsp20/alpha crystallin family protein [Alphaproteobacteria bacterium]